MDVSITYKQKSRAGGAQGSEWDIMFLQQSVRCFQVARALKLTVRCCHLACHQGASQLRHSSCIRVYAVSCSSNYQGKTGELSIHLGLSSLEENKRLPLCLSTEITSVKGEITEVLY